MATNRSHVQAAYDALVAKVEAAKEVIENKEEMNDADDARVEAYDQFLSDIESAWDDCTSALDDASNN